MARLDELERKFEENPRRYFAPLANEYRKAGDPRRAAELCRSQLPEIPGHISGHIVLGQALFDTGDHSASREALETALALDPDNIVALRYLGDIAWAIGDHAQAEEWYSRTIDADPYNEAAHAALESLRAANMAADPLPDPVGDRESDREEEAIVELPTESPDQSGPIDEQPAPPEPFQKADSFSEPVVVDEMPAPGESTVEDTGEAAEFAGDLTVSTVPELPELEPVVEESPLEPVVAERFDTDAHPVPDPAAAEDQLQAEERVMEAAAPFVTETMADLYMEQGYPHEALELLLQLSEQRPHDEELRHKVEHIESIVLARRDAAIAAARAERAERAEDASPEPEPEPEPEPSPAEPAIDEPVTVRDMFARMDLVRPRASQPTAPRPISRLRSDFVPQQEEAEEIPVAAPLSRASGPHPTFDPSTADIEDFDAWLRGLRGP